MPYTIKRRGSKWAVTKEGSDKALGTHSSREQAEAQVRALYAKEGETRKSRKRK